MSSVTFDVISFQGWTDRNKRSQVRHGETDGVIDRSCCSFFQSPSSWLSSLEKAMKVSAMNSFLSGLLDRKKYPHRQKRQASNDIKEAGKKGIKERREWKREGSQEWDRKSWEDREKTWYPNKCTETRSRRQENRKTRRKNSLLCDNLSSFSRSCLLYSSQSWTSSPNTRGSSCFSISQRIDLKQQRRKRCITSWSPTRIGERERK